MFKTPDSLAAGLIIAVLVALLAYRHRAKVQATVVGFWTESDCAFNLALFRIAFFVLATLWLPGPADVKGFGSLPDSLLKPPDLLGPLYASFPRTPSLIEGAYWLLIAFGLLAALGLATRASALIWTVAASYYLGLPNLFGKVDHDMHLLWISATLALSPCADVLSLGSFISGSRGIETSPSDSRHRRYALPLRLIWTYLSLAYLFAGLWKYAVDGLNWFSPGTLRGWIFFAWAQRQGFEATIDPSSSSLLLVAGAVGTLLFELGFALLIYQRVTRHLAAAAGLVFHNSIGMTMGIPFVSLQLVYVSLIDWAAAVGAVLRRRPQLYFLTDANCGLCQKTQLALRPQTLPSGVVFANAQDPLTADLFRDLPEPPTMEQLVTDIHAWDGTDVHIGFAAYRRLAWRVPLLWVLLPFAYLPPIPQIGARIYRVVADRRTCGVKPPAPKPRRLGWVGTPALIGVPIIVVAVACGLLRLGSGWPVSLYPTFAGLPPQKISSFTLSEGAAESSTGEASQMGAATSFGGALNFMSQQRLATFLNGLGAGSDRTERVRDFLKWLQVREPSAQLTLTERTYAIGQRGKLVEQSSKVVGSVNPKLPEGAQR